MQRRDFIRSSTLAGLGTGLTFDLPLEDLKKTDDRAYWVEVISRIADPLLVSLSKGQLRKNMPVRSNNKDLEGRRQVTHLEGYGRLLAGMAPWLELGKDATPEGQSRGRYLDLAGQAMERAVNPQSPDFLNFTEGDQPLVDAAFLAHSLVRAPKALFENLETGTRKHLLAALKATRKILPHYNNWLLFSGMIEAALAKLGQQPDTMRLDYAIRQHMAWYKGDGVYGDGAEFHFDYYNSYVIHPMLLDIVGVMKERQMKHGDLYETVLKRARRYAAIQERLISPEGTFPVVGRSIPYRFGAFQALSQIALLKELPQEIHPAQVRSALTAVIRRTMAAPNTFDKDGWLHIGLYGHQPDLAENYLSTGSMYLCSTGLLALGLPAPDPFWSAPAQPWTAQRIWSGENMKADKAFREG